MVLSEEPNPAAVVWSIDDVEDDDTSATGVHDEVILSISGASLTRLNGGQTQTLLLESYSQVQYFQTIINNANEIFGVTAFNVDRDIWDIITPESSGSTVAAGRYVQLTTNDGTQQQLTAVTNSNGGSAITDFLTADIEGTNNAPGGGSIEFPAVQIFDNPAGISGDQVRTALINDLRILNNNVVIASVKPGAVQSAQTHNGQNGATDL